jgi:hypothetical protein
MDRFGTLTVSKLTTSPLELRWARFVSSTHLKT